MERSFLVQPRPLPERRRQRAQQDGSREGLALRLGQAPLRGRSHRSLRGLPLPRHPHPKVKVQQYAGPDARHDPGVWPHHEAQALPLARHAETRVRISMHGVRV